MDELIEEAEKWIDTDHILCADGYEQAEDIIAALVERLRLQGEAVDAVKPIILDRTYTGLQLKTAVEALSKLPTGKE